jgi:hypothetical protein
MPARHIKLRDSRKESLLMTGGWKTLQTKLFLFSKHSKKLNFANFYTIQWRHKALLQTIVTVTYFMHCWGIQSHISRLQEIKK